MQLLLSSLYGRAQRLLPASLLPSRIFSTTLQCAGGVLALGLLISCAPAARADSFSVYTVSGVGFGDQSLSGTFTIDTTTDVLESVDLNAGGVSLTAIQSQSDCSQGIAGLLGPGDVAFDLGDNLLVLGSGSEVFIGTATLSSSTATANATAAPTPEPSTLLLLSTGLIAIAYTRRNRTSSAGGRAAAPATPKRLEWVPMTESACFAGPQQDATIG